MRSFVGVPIRVGTEALTVTDDGTAENGLRGTAVTWQAPL